MGHESDSDTQDSAARYVVAIPTTISGQSLREHLSSIGGLIAWRVLRGTNGMTILLTEWESAESYRVFGNDLTQKSGGESPALAGWVQGSSGNPKSWWRRHWAALLTAGSLLIGFAGFLEALRHHHAWLLAKPDIAVARSSNRPVDALAGDEFAVTMELRNLSRFGSTSIRQVQATLRPATTRPASPVKPVDDQQVLYEELQGGDTVTGSARFADVLPGRYVASFDFQCSSGMARSPQKVPATLPVRVWAIRDRSPLEIENIGVEGKMCRFKTIVHVGQSHQRGFRGYAMLQSDPELELKAASSPDLAFVSSESPFSGEGTGYVSVAQWTTEAVPAFRDVVVRLPVRAKRVLDKDQWEQVRQSLDRSIVLSGMLN